MYTQDEINELEAAKAAYDKASKEYDDAIKYKHLLGPVLHEINLSEAHGKMDDAIEIMDRIESEHWYDEENYDEQH